jgi:predicted nucleic acid-binding protein
VLVLVDTCIWSLALRRRSKDLAPKEASYREELGELAEQGRVRLAGPIRQEILSGVRDTSQYEQLREYLRAFPDEPLAVTDYELAAAFSNKCRGAGVSGSAVDFLICAAASSRKWAIFTCDGDFESYRRILGIALHSPRE